MASSSTKFTSEGFDLDAAVSSECNGNADDGDVIYEIGGGATMDDPATAKEEEHEHEHEEEPAVQSPMDIAEEWKQKGNVEFKKQNYDGAYDLYTKSIEVCPCPVNIEDVVRQRDEFDEQERDKARQRMEEDTNKQRNRRRESSNNSIDTGNDKKEDNDSSSRNTTTATSDDDDNDNNNNAKKRPEPLPTFVLPTYMYGDKLAIFLNNRAAASIQLERYEEAIQDADVALLLNPKYAKGYVRRSSAYEKTERTEEALHDIKRALQYDPHNATIRKNVQRLQKIEEERMEKLKTETMGKLKDLGNSLLGNFGLSLDNFNAVQDPNTGSYSISFDQNKK